MCMQNRGKTNAGTMKVAKKIPTRISRKLQKLENTAKPKTTASQFLYETTDLLSREQLKSMNEQTERSNERRTVNKQMEQFAHRLANRELFVIPCQFNSVEFRDKIDKFSAAKLKWKLMVQI